MLAALGALAVAAAEQPGQCLPSARPPPDAPPRSVSELNALIAEYEGGLAALRRERREAYREARRAGSPDVFASGLDLPAAPAGLKTWLAQPCSWRRPRPISSPARSSTSTAASWPAATGPFEREDPQT